VAWMTCITFILTTVFANAQTPENETDTVTLVHDTYTSVFAKSAHIPVVVTYTLRGSDITCMPKVERSNNFRADPMLLGTSLEKDYAKSGYDCGHNMSAEDNACSAAHMNDCFYYTNMYPQRPGLNRGIWKRLEVQERKMAVADDSVIVWVGSYGSSKTIGPDKVVVPDYCWKVIYIPKLDTWLSYSFPNINVLQPVFSAYNVPAEQVPWIRYVVNHWGGGTMP